MAHLCAFAILVVGMTIFYTDAATCPGSTATLCTSSSSSACASACASVQTTGGTTFSPCCVSAGGSYTCMCCNQNYQFQMGMPGATTSTCPPTTTSSTPPCPCNCFTPQVTYSTCTSQAAAGSRNTTVEGDYSFARSFLQ